MQGRVLQDFLVNYQAYIALGLMALTFIGFLFEKLPPEVTAAIGAAAFVLFGYVSPAQTFSVFSNPAPLTIAAMFVLTGAMVRTGVLERVVGIILDFAGDNAARAVICLVAGIMLLGGFINNTPLVLILIPIGVRIAHKFGFAPTRLLIPISYFTILAGTLTLIGTSTNLLVDGVAREHGMEPFSIFEITPVGMVTAISGLLLLGLFGRFLLPDRKEEGGDLDGENAQFLSEITIIEEGDFTQTKIGEIAALKLPNLKVRAVNQSGTITRKDIRSIELKRGDRLAISATASELLTLHDIEGIRIGTGAIQPREKTELAMVEAVVGPNQSIQGRRIDQLAISSQFGVRVLGVNRHNHIAGQDLRSAKLRAADRLLIEGPAAGVDALSQRGVLVSVTRTSGRAYRQSKAPITLAALAGVVALAAFGVMDIGILAMLAVVAILALRCIDSEEAWGAIDGGILVLIFAMLIVGLGLQNAGSVDLIVSAIAPHLTGLSPLLLLVTIYMMTSALTELITNNAVAVVMTPIVIALSVELGVDPRPLVVAVMFAASASFATPIGYQTNTLVYGAANYRFTDFVKVGIPMNVVVGLATCAAIYFFYGMTG
ncbi:SLC13 family permease [Aureimonas fodinaquatilis]|uniref:SLC13 family permease n=1 Tax=Aureimonas fodinaquatilis TaxID=2565783 RepID=A0A5B0DZH5_9HYPH|nr:SLC13 family permease [Aureimonas fodinaquatilis]KAA0971943.1 SLC13 family permease [Aureimonas fodinaquatilis]